MKRTDTEAHSAKRRQQAETIAAALKKHGRMTAMQISQATSIPIPKVTGALGQMARRKMARPVAYERGAYGKAIWEAYTPRPVDKRLPMFAEAPGTTRDDCRRYLGCLDRFVRHSFSQTEASCPSDCAHFVKVKRDDLINEAMAGRGQHPLAAMEVQ